MHASPGVAMAAQAPPTTSPIQQTQPVPQLRKESSVILPPQHRPRKDGRRLLLMLTLIAGTLALVLGLMLWEGWDDFDEALIDRGEVRGNPPTAAPSPAPTTTPATPPPLPVSVGPAIHVPLASVRVWQELPVVVRLVDDGSWTGRVHYRPVGTTAWRRVELAEESSGRLETSISITEELGAAIEYWIELGAAGREPLQIGSAGDPYSVSIL